MNVRSRPTTVPARTSTSHGPSVSTHIGRIALSDVAQDRAEQEAGHSKGCITSAALHGTAGLWQVAAESLRARCSVAPAYRSDLGCAA